MVNIFEDTDYRKFLRDYYTQRKKEFPSFSYQMLSNLAGFPNRGYLFNVFKGDKNLTKSSSVKLVQALKLNGREADYFENLVSFNQAKNVKERNYYFDKISSIKSNREGALAIRETRKEEYAFYSLWYVSVIRSLLEMHQFKDNYKELAASVYPPIKPKEAKGAVLLLEKLGMIIKQKDGYYKGLSKTITAGTDIIQLGLLNFQSQTAELASRAILNLSKEKRHISGLTLGISKEAYTLICKEIETFQLKLLAIAEKDCNSDNVYQLNFHVFPVSNVHGLITRKSTSKDLQKGRNHELL